MIIRTDLVLSYKVIELLLIREGSDPIYEIKNKKHEAKQTKLGRQHTTTQTIYNHLIKGACSRNMTSMVK